MTTLAHGTTVVDTRPPHTGTIAVRPLTPRLRLELGEPADADALFAIVRYAGGQQTLLCTDLDVYNIVDTGRVLAFETGARFVEVDDACLYCGRPAAVGATYCTPRPGRDCQTLFRRADVYAWDQAHTVQHAEALRAPRAA